MKGINLFFLTPMATAVLISTLFSACSEKQQEKKSQTPDKGTVQVVQPETDHPFYTVTLPGELKPYEDVTLFPKVKGFIKHILADRGSYVRKGQVLAVLEAPEIAQNYRSARSEQQKYYEEYTFSRQSYRRILNAAKKDGSVAGIELDRAFSKMKSDSAAYIAALSNTDASGQLEKYLKIMAPFDGTVVERNISVGALVGDNNTAPLFRIVQTEKLRLTVAIPEKHAQSVRENTEVSFTVSNRPGKIFRSALSRRSQMLEQQNRSVAAEFDVANGDGSLGGGEYAQVTLKLKRPEATLWVPSSSVVHAQSATFLLVVENDKIRRVPVQVGMKKGSVQEIFGELSEKSVVVLKGTEELAEDSIVTTTRE